MRTRAAVVIAFVVGIPVVLSLFNYRRQHAPALTRTNSLQNVAGAIELGVLEPGSRKSTLYVYRVSPAEGATSLAATQELDQNADLSSEGLPAGAHISTCSDEKSSHIASPDQRYIAACQQALVGTRLTNSILIEDSVSGGTIKRVPIEDFSHVRGMAWSPNSDALAVLKESERMGYGPIELLEALSGHPVRYSTIGFVAVAVDRNEGQGLPYVGREFRSAWCFIKWRQ